MSCIQSEIQPTMTRWIAKLFILITFLFYVTEGATNLARARPTVQSQTFENNNDQFGPQKAVDGRLDTFISTAEQANQWWTVDLEAEYMIARVDIYNRDGYYERLSKISVRSSNLDSPGAAAGSDWTQHYYQEQAFDSIGSVGFNPPITARHILIYSQNSAGLTMNEVEVYETVNLAQNRPASQSTTLTYNDGAYEAGRAVNGKYNDFSHTLEGIAGWWKVDLQAKYSIGEIQLYNREGYYNRLARVSIFTSVAVSTQGITPSNSTPIWTLRHYQHEPYGTRGGVQFNPPIEVQHVAVHCAAGELTLKEVVVYEFNYALSQTATHTGGSSKYPASNAVDGSVNTFSTTVPPVGNSNNWWMVSFNRQTLLRRTRVYVRNGGCDEGPCASRLSDVHILTVKNSTGVPPNSVGDGGWDICYHSAPALGETFDVTCTGGKTPLTKQFSIRTNTGVSVGLREVEVYGFELPQLTNGIDGQTDSTTTTSVTVSFLKWIQTMPGGQPPTRNQSCR